MSDASEQRPRRLNVTMAQTNSATALVSPRALRQRINTHRQCNRRTHAYSQRLPVMVRTNRSLRRAYHS
jgi:hypothetical protein